MNLPICIHTVLFWLFVQYFYLTINLPYNFLDNTPSVLKNLTFRTATRSPKHNFDLLSL
jgi:hypothetical protein